MMSPISLVMRINQLKPLLVDLFQLSPAGVVYVLGLNAPSST